jgi:hypothetical protein
MQLQIDSEDDFPELCDLEQNFKSKGSDREADFVASQSCGTQLANIGNLCLNKKIPVDRGIT